PDGGRDNEELGCVEVSFRRELPRESASRFPIPTITWHDPREPGPHVDPSHPAPNEPFDPTHLPTPRRPMAPPEWMPPTFNAMSRSAPAARVDVRKPGVPGAAERETGEPRSDMIERAAGTGLTGRSAQEFERLVIGTDAAFDAPRPLPDEAVAPARPAARP